MASARTRAPAAGADGRVDPAETLARYAPLVADWDAFVAALRAPRPTCLVVNRARLDRERLARLLAAEDLPAAPVAWTDGALRVPAGARPGLWWPTQVGLCQIQEEASLLPVHLLAPAPGERVLDLCAAPGGKAAQIALAVGPDGTVVANDRDTRRLSAVRDKMKRLGLANLTTTAHNGGEWPLGCGGFDRVLVDAPCSAEGTNAAAGAAYATSSARFRARLGRQQRALLRRALDLVRPGGRVVYATCSLAPEENEAVVAEVLAEVGDGVRVVPVPIPGLDSAPGLSAWAGERFPPALWAAHRLWPAHSGTGGFFAVALERRADLAAPETAAAFAPPAGEATDMADWLAVLRRHFGLPAGALDGLRFLARGEEIQIVTDAHRLPPRPAAVSSGLPLTRRAGAWPKPTTGATLWLGAAATRNVVALDRAQRDAYLARRPVTPRPDQLAACDAKGYVVVCFDGVPLGLAIQRPGPPPRLDSEFPRIWATPPTASPPAAAEAAHDAG